MQDIIPNYRSTSTGSSQSPYPATQKALQWPVQSGGKIRAHSPSGPETATIRPKKDKTVHWASSVVDNEFKTKLSPKSPPTIEARPESSTPSPVRSSSSLPLGTPLANTSVKMSSNPSSRQQPTQMPSQIHQLSSTASKASPHQRPHISSSRANISRKMGPPSVRRPPKVKYAVPPPVPDAPWTQRPPPAPRPNRLLTPELPEIDASKLFGVSPFQAAHGSPLGPSQGKMDLQRELL
jgi:hypothetical protein